MLCRLRWLSTLVMACLACGRGELPHTAQPDITEMLRADLEAIPNPADGGGRGWLVSEESDVPAVASQPGLWTIEYEAGPLGIDVGGALFLQVSPFWGWSTPQVVYEDAPGFTRVATTAGGVELEAQTLDQQLLAIVIRGRRLEPGETVRIVYGSGPAGAYADQFAESDSRFWLAVDGDGDGRRKVLTDSPSVPVVAGPGERLVVHLPSTAEVGEEVRLTVAMVDAAGNAATGFVGEVELEADLPVDGWPRVLRFAAEDGGSRTLEFRTSAQGVLRVTARTGSGIEARSNPLVVSTGERILWADLHGHSGLSDGTGSPSDYFRYARDVGALDVVALTDHDHWGIEPLATHPELWERIRQAVERFDEPGRFVTLLGFEWTSWIYGHRHVLYFSDRGEVLNSVDADLDHPRELWAALDGQLALTFAHHSAGGPIATDWSIPPDPVIEPLTEVVSVHGSSEASDSPFTIYNPVPGNFARDALDRGYRLGFVGSGDGHDGHPGLAHLASPRMGGVAAIFAEDLTREAVLAALRERRAYATNGPRIVLKTTLDGLPMGSVVPPTDSSELEIDIAATSFIRGVEIVRSGRSAEWLRCEAGGLECSARARLEDLSSGEYVYLRITQDDGGVAWSSPFFVD